MTNFALFGQKSSVNEQIVAAKNSNRLTGALHARECGA
jgi:hypothetical protein